MRTLIHLNLAPQGLHPGQPAITNDNRLFIVPCQDTHNVLLIDSQRLDLIANLPLRSGASPSAAEVAHDNRTCAVALSEWSQQGSRQRNSSVAIIDLIDRRLVSEYAVGPGPNGMLFWERGGHRYLFVANTRGASVSVLDMDNHWSEVARIPVGKAPFSISELPERGEIAVANFEDASVSIISVATLAITRTVVVGNSSLSDPHPEWGHGDTTWVEQVTETIAIATNWRSNQLVEFDLGTGDILRRVTSPIEQPFFVRRLLQTDSFILAGSPRREIVSISRATLLQTDRLAIYSEGYPTGDLLRCNGFLNDPDDHSLVVFAPDGLSGLAMGPFIPFGPI